MRDFTLEGRSLSAAGPQLDSGRKKELLAFQKNANIRFRSLELLNLSFIHRSALNETPHKVNNERLEFLGDSVLGAATATLLYERLEDRQEGDLAKIKSVVVSEEILSGVSLELQIDRHLILGKGEELSGGRNKKAILADALEALIGAYYLDSGYEASFGFIKSFMNNEIDRVLENRYKKDYKTALQELSQRLFHTYPSYIIAKRSGPEHERLFNMEVTVDGRMMGAGLGKSKKDAEQAAAKVAFESLSSQDMSISRSDHA